MLAQNVRSNYIYLPMFVQTNWVEASNVLTCLFIYNVFFNRTTIISQLNEHYWFGSHLCYTCEVCLTWMCSRFYICYCSVIKQYSDVFDLCLWYESYMCMKNSQYFLLDLFEEKQKFMYSVKRYSVFEEYLLTLYINFCFSSKRSWSSTVLAL